MGLLTTLSGSSAAFSPMQLSNLALWLDGSDLATLTIDGSNRVSQWDDKSGNGMHATQGTTMEQPVFSGTAANGMPGLTFDGSDDRLLSGTNSSWNYLHEQSGATLFIACHITTANPDNYLAILSTFDGGSGNVGLALSSEDRAALSANQRTRIDIGRGSGYAVTANTTDAAFPYQQSVVFSARCGTEGGATNDALLYINDTQTEAVDNALTPATGNSMHALTIGNLNTGTGNGLVGVIHEVLIYNRKLSLAEHTSVTDYLATKYGM